MPLAAAALALAALAGPAPAQAPAARLAAGSAPADTGLVYRREVFDYAAAGRPDPFRPLLNAADMGVRVEDLRLTAVVYNPNPRLCVAVFARTGTAGSLRVRVGQRVGNLTVMAIYPRRVDVRVEEFGQGRVQSMTVQRQPFPGADASAAPPPVAGADGAVQVQAPASTSPVAQARALGPLTRGGRKPAAAPAAPQTQTPQPQRPNYP